MATKLIFEIRTPEEEKRAQQNILQTLEEHKYPDKVRFAVRLAMEEALVNATKHGNGMDLEKKVTVVCRIDNSQVHIEIEDEGSGFDLNALPDPTAPENLERPCGRGVLLMQAFMTSVEFNEVGNKVTMTKRRVEENGEQKKES